MSAAHRRDEGTGARIAPHRAQQLGEFRWHGVVLSHCPTCRPIARGNSLDRRGVHVVGGPIDLFFTHPCRTCRASCLAAVRGSDPPLSLPPSLQDLPPTLVRCLHLPRVVSSQMRSTYASSVCERASSRRREKLPVQGEKLPLYRYHGSLDLVQLYRLEWP